MGPAQPFLRFRGLLHACHLAREAGATDAECVEEIERAVEFLPPLRSLRWSRLEILEEVFGIESGSLRCKSETDESATIRRRQGWCIGRAFLSRWLALAIEVADEPPDACNGFVFDAGASLGWELAADRLRDGVDLHRVFVGVGDGLVASGLVHGLREAYRLGALPRLPRLHLVEPAGGPLSATFDQVSLRILSQVHADLASQRIWEAAQSFPRVRQQIADSLQAGLQRAADDRVRTAVEQGLRAQVIERPADPDAASLVREPADWFGLVRGMLESGGFSISVTDDQLSLARELLDSIDSAPVSPLGCAALAGIIRLRTAGDLETDENVAIVAC
ncbi:MAG: hypothetical protein KC729_08210 [Candidatus Eisenbacteria bacterium]|uniref:Pyridoxal-phosphate dependent enzyme n=1 Tax=Eiseniibacteriota bacterium TaxID=2212470 RepID=A0A956LZ41_UNCEI|nr:hypothetical protein [Candidatus Eisenbacteria bacterium]